MELPDRLEICGRWYRAEDTIVHEAEPPAIERWFSVKELVKSSGFSRSSIYRAMDSGRLAYKCPNGSNSGRRVEQSEWTRFLSTIPTCGG